MAKSAAAPPTQGTIVGVPPAVHRTGVSPRKPLVLFGLYDVLIMGKSVPGRHEGIFLRPGIHHLRRLCDSGVDVGIYTSLPLHGAFEALVWVQTAMVTDVPTNENLTTRRLPTCAKREKLLKALIASCRAAAMRPRGNSSKFSAAFQKWVASFGGYALGPILVTKHCIYAEDDRCPRLLKPLWPYVSTSRWVVLVEHDPGQVCSLEKSRLLQVPTWTLPGCAPTAGIRDDDGEVLRVVVDELLRSLEMERNVDCGIPNITARFSLHAARAALHRLVQKGTPAEAQDDPTQTSPAVRR